MLRACCLSRSYSRGGGFRSQNDARQQSTNEQAQSAKQRSTFAPVNQTLCTVWVLVSTTAMKSSSLLSATPFANQNSWATTCVFPVAGL